MRRIIACDLDSVMVDTPRYWYEWLEEVTHAGYSYEEVSHMHNFGEIYDPLMKSHGCVAMDWWRQQWLYQPMKPINNSVEVLTEMSENFDIVVVSASKAAHFKSKYYWVKHHFPFIKGFYASKEKGGIRADIAIDDRNEYLRQYKEYGVTTVRYQTPHKQAINLHPTS